MRIASAEIRPIEPAQVILGRKTKTIRSAISIHVPSSNDGRMRIFATIIFLFVLTFSGFSQGVVSGTVKGVDGEILDFCSIAIILPSDRTLWTSTDKDGNYSLKVEPGVYTIMASFLGYRELAIENIEVRENEITKVDFVLDLDILICFPSVVVLSSRPFTVSNIYQSDIEKQNLGQDVPFLLKMTPSAVVTSDAGAGVGYSGSRVRGSDQTNINVTVNGIPLNDSESHQVYWVDLPDVMASADNLEIERGVGTSKNGAGAFGATINIATKSPSVKPALTLGTTYGSFNTQKYSLEAGTGDIKLDDDPSPRAISFNGRISKIKSDGYIDRATSNLNSFFLSGNYKKDKTKLQVNVISGHEITYQAWNGVPLNYIDIDSLRTYNSAGMERADKPHPDQVDNYKQTHYQLILENRIFDRIKVDAALHYTKGAGYYEQYKGGQNVFNYGSDSVTIGGVLVEESDLIRRKWLDNDFYGGVFNIKIPVWAGIDIGGGWNKYKGQHFGKVIWSQLSGIPQGHEYYRNESTKKDFNIYAKANLQVEKFNAYLDFQYRNLVYDFAGLDEQGNRFPEKVKHHFLNPKLGISYYIKSTLLAYVSMATAHREPNRSDYQNNSVHNKPKAERLIDWEAGLRGRANKYRYSINGFFMKYKDQLVLTGKLTDVGEYARVNVPESYRLGVELDGTIQTWNWLAINGNFTWSKNQISAFTEYIDNWDTWAQETEVHKKTALAFSPAVTSALALNFSLFEDRLKTSLSGKYVGKQYLDNTSNEATALSAYFYNDLQVNYLFAKSNISYLLNLKVNNLFNRKYSSNGWAYRYRTANEYIGPFDQPEGNGTYSMVGLYPQAGINFLLGLVVKF